MIIEQAVSYFYKGFGLKFKSDIPFPELFESIETSDYEVSISVGDLANIWKETGAKLDRFNILDGNGVLFQVPDTAIFYVQDGRYITVSPYPNGNMDKIRLFLLGSCMGVILMQRGTIPLHGSAVVIQGEAYAIVGESGTGKSTLAAAFINKGYFLLTDDVIPVVFSALGSPVVMPTYPRQKLWQESLNQFNGSIEHYQSLYGRETKYAVPVDHAFSNEAIPLKGIIELKPPADFLQISPLNKLEKLQTLYNQTFRSLLLQRMGLLEWHFRIAAKIAEQVKMYQISRPNTGFSANEMADLILATVSGGEKT
ncbi:aldolase [Fictibacillus fluitans]|uniref:Aldolase n=1 Tax=Fictibacillus fluitans TaxID=3058422 RepID=A0ABT8I190_9BACL|nr:aldolase [Fictibacillus sp. NE201]MDN4526744.1 aldolase [Fictibacillus sp. NE201]